MSSNSIYGRLTYNHINLIYFLSSYSFKDYQFDCVKLHLCSLGQATTNSTSSGNTDLGLITLMSSKCPQISASSSMAPSCSFSTRSCLENIDLLQKAISKLSLELEHSIQLKDYSLKAFFDLNKVFFLSPF